MGPLAQPCGSPYSFTLQSYITRGICSLFTMSFQNNIIGRILCSFDLGVSGGGVRLWLPRWRVMVRKGVRRPLSLAVYYHRCRPLPGTAVALLLLTETKR